MTIRPSTIHSAPPPLHQKSVSLFAIHASYLLNSGASRTDRSSKLKLDEDKDDILEEDVDRQSFKTWLPLRCINFMHFLRSRMT